MNRFFLGTFYKLIFLQNIFTNYNNNCKLCIEICFIRKMYLYLS